MNSIVETLTAARDLLIRDGICRGTYHDASNRHCIVGALSWVAFDDQQLNDAFHALECLLDGADATVGLFDDTNGGSVIDFNDTHTDYEIIALLNTAITEAC